MKTIIVYRIENRRREGMYAASGAPGMDFYTFKEDINKQPHPGPYNDKELYFTFTKHYDNLFFGFGSLQQLKKWIGTPGFLEALIDKGYKITKLRAKGKISRFQAVYLKGTREYIATISLKRIRL